LRLPSINLIICFGDDTLYAAAAAAAAELDEECEAEREECEEREEDKEALEERAGEPRRDDELDLGEAEAEEDFLGLGDIKGLCGLNTAEDDEDREADDEDEADDIELLAAGDILLYCSGVPDEGLPFVILRLTIACNIRACAFSIP
jgi:hypothetical protein